MLKRKFTRLIMVVAAFCVTTLHAEDVALEGAKPGEWTMDLAAAKKLAKSKQLPVFLNFTGSDWCGWCKLMDKSVFSQEAWKQYAKDELVLVTLDFPKKDPSIVPEKYRERNAELQEQLEIKGFPTYVLLDSDGKTELGRLGASRNSTPESFIEQLKGALRYRATEVAAYAKELKPKDKAKYLKMVTDMKTSQKAVAENQAIISKATKAMEALEASIAEQKEDIREFRAAQLGKAELKKYKDAKVALEKLQKEMEAWMATRPARNEENMKKAQEMSQKIQALETTLSAF